MADPTWFHDLVAVASGILTIAACVVVIAAIPLAFVVRRVARQLTSRLSRVERDVAPLLQDLAAAARDLKTVSTAVRGDVEAVHGTFAEVNDRVRAVIGLAERRVQELDAVFGVAQSEIEGVVESAIATARGVRAGASVLGGIVGGYGSSRRPAAASPAPPATDHGGETLTYDSGELGDGDEHWGKAGNGRQGPRVRPRRRRG